MAPAPARAPRARAPAPAPARARARARARDSLGFQLLPVQPYKFGRIWPGGLFRMLIIEMGLAWARALYNYISEAR